MNQEYLERNADYVAAMEEVIVRLKYEGRFLTAQSLYTFAGAEVAGSMARVRELSRLPGVCPGCRSPGAVVRCGRRSGGRGAVLVVSGT